MKPHWQWADGPCIVDLGLQEGEWLSIQWCDFMIGGGARES